MRKSSPILMLLFMLSAAAAQASGGHAAALGKPGDPARVDRTIEMNASDDMRYSPNTIHIKRGQTVRFRVANNGKTKHEMVLGTLAELKEHSALMRRFPKMEHDDPNAISIPPGQTGELVWRFTKTGDFYFGCLVPGHFEAGMHGKIVVRP